MNPPPFCYALYSSWTSTPRRVPDRCMGDLWDRLTDDELTTALAPRREPCRQDTPVLGMLVRFLRHDSGGRGCQKKNPRRLSLQGSDAPSAHRRPGYSLSGCTPAKPDSASPGGLSLAKHQDRHKASGRQAVRLGSVASPELQPRKGHRQDTPVRVGQGRPSRRSKKTKRAFPWKVC